MKYRVTEISVEGIVAGYEVEFFAIAWGRYRWNEMGGRLFHSQADAEEFVTRMVKPAPSRTSRVVKEYE